MELEIELTKSVEENAAHYFELSKKAKKKMLGAQRALEETKKKLAKLQQEEAKFWEDARKKEAERVQKAERNREWYEKFHWFISSEDFLCIGGKDSTSNEIIIKKHLEKEDIVFHTEAAGSPFFLVKGGQKAGEKTLQEAAQMVAVYSRAWKLGMTMTDVFWVLPEQVTKEAKPGEFIQKGSFMIYGKKNFYHPVLELAMGLVDGKIIAGPLSAVKSAFSTSVALVASVPANDTFNGKSRVKGNRPEGRACHPSVTGGGRLPFDADQYVIVIPQGEKKSDLAKKIKHQLGGGDLDEIIAFLPGEGQLKK